MGRDPSGIGHFLSPGEACEIMIGPLQPSLDSKVRPYTDKNWLVSVAVSMVFLQFMGAPDGWRGLGIAAVCGSVYCVEFRVLGAQQMVTCTSEWEWRETGASDPWRALGTSGIGDRANRVAVAEIEEHGVDDGVSRGRLTISQGARRRRTSALAILADGRDDVAFVHIGEPNAMIEPAKSLGIARHHSRRPDRPHRGALGDEHARRNDDGQRRPIT